MKSEMFVYGGSSVLPYLHCVTKIITNIMRIEKSRLVCVWLWIITKKTAKRSKKFLELALVTSRIVRHKRAYAIHNNVIHSNISIHTIFPFFFAPFSLHYYTCFVPYFGTLQSTVSECVDRKKSKTRRNDFHIKSV